MACILLWSSSVRVHDSQAYRKMDVTREHSCILELREIVLSFQTGFNLVNAAVVCAILENIPGFEPSSFITEPRYLKLVTVSSFCPFTLTSVLMPLVLSSVWSSWHGSPCRRLWRLCHQNSAHVRPAAWQQNICCKHAHYMTTSNACLKPTDIVQAPYLGTCINHLWQQAGWSISFWCPTWEYTLSHTQREKKVEMILKTWSWMDW